MIMPVTCLTWKTFLRLWHLITLSKVNGVQINFMGKHYCGSPSNQVLCPRDWRSGGILFLSCLLFCHSLWNFNLADNFWTESARALIFHMNIPRDKTIIFYPVTLTLGFDPFFENFNLANNFWTVSARAFIFLMNIPSEKIFLLVLNLLNLTFDLFIFFSN